MFSLAYTIITHSRKLEVETEVSPCCSSSGKQETWDSHVASWECTVLLLIEIFFFFFWHYYIVVTYTENYSLYLSLFFFLQIQQLKNLSKEICDMLSPVKSLHLPPLFRGAAVNTYYPTVDDLLIQYDFDRYRL